MHDGYVMNWQKCKCTRLETATGNGCIHCNPEKAYFIANAQADKEREERRDLPPLSREDFIE